VTRLEDWCWANFERESRRRNRRNDIPVPYPLLQLYVPVVTHEKLPNSEVQWAAADEEVGDADDCIQIQNGSPMLFIQYSWISLVR
jgi:hypothetical protein